MKNMGPLHFYTGIPDSKTATLPSYPKKGKAPVTDTPKPVKAVTRVIWGGYTAEIKHKESDE